MAEVPANWNLTKSEQLHSHQAHIKELISHITIANSRYTSVLSTLGTRATALTTEHYAATDEDRRLRLSIKWIGRKNYHSMQRPLLVVSARAHNRWIVEDNYALAHAQRVSRNLVPYVDPAVGRHDVKNLTPVILERAIIWFSAHQATRADEKTFENASAQAQYTSGKYQAVVRSC